MNDNIENEDVVTTGFYTESDLIEFANYCLSEERKDRYIYNIVNGETYGVSKGLSLEDRLKQVNDTDLDAFLNTVRR